MSTDNQHASSATEGDTFALGNPREYRCHVALIPEDEGDFSAVVLNLPGVGSCGATASEALESAREAIQATLATYQEMRMAPPWRLTSDGDVPAGAEATWFAVNR